MAKQAKSKSGRRKRPLYFSAKISDYQFRKVLWHFTLDHSAAETARHVKLSANSISAIFAKLRRFFFDYGLFNDPFKGSYQRVTLPFDGFEKLAPLIASFHAKRMRTKHGSMSRKAGESDYHFAESFWRFCYLSFHDERGEEYAHLKMYATLLAFVRQFGPVGSKAIPKTSRMIEGRLLSLELLSQAALWWSRNSRKLRETTTENIG